MRNVLTSLALLSTLAASTPAFAGWSTVGTMSTTADEGSKELFAEGTGGTYSCPTGSGAWLTQVYAGGYTNYYHGTEAEAWSSDWEESGSDWFFNDAADISFYCGHGFSGGFTFGGSAGDNVVYSTETRWGNGDLEAVHLQTCSALDAAGRSAFAAANINRGVHWILGFQTTALDTSSTADLDGYYLKLGYDYDTSWYYATSSTHGSESVAAAVRFVSSSCNTYYDDIYSMSCDPTSGAWTVETTWTL